MPRMSKAKRQEMELANALNGQGFLALKEQSKRSSRSGGRSESRMCDCADGGVLSGGSSSGGTLSGGFNPLMLLPLASMVAPLVGKLFGSALSGGNFSGGDFSGAYGGTLSGGDFSGSFGSDPQAMGGSDWGMNELKKARKARNGGAKGNGRRGKSLNQGASSWVQEVKAYQRNHPGMSYSEALKGASRARSGGYMSGGAYLGTYGDPAGQNYRYK